MFEDAHHEIGKYVCSRHGCTAISEIDTEMGGMCRRHSSPLQFPVFLDDPYSNPTYVPWEFMRPHEVWARRNHGQQTLARLAERGGLSVAEAIAILEGIAWGGHKLQRRGKSVNVAEFRKLLADWQSAR